MDKNTKVLIVKRENGSIVSINRAIAESFESYTPENGWEKVDNRPVVMVRNGSNWVEEVNSNYEESVMQEIEDFKNRGDE